MKAKIKFNTIDDAVEFAIMYSRKTLRGHTIKENEVQLYGITDEEKLWIDEYIHNHNQLLSNTSHL